MASAVGAAARGRSVIGGWLVADFAFGQDLVAALLREQHPDLADLPLRDVEGGWDNQLWRLGEDLAVRLPRTERAPALLSTEQTWLPVLAGRLPLPTPVPVRIGAPSARFPHTWTIARWVHGDPADLAPVTDLDAAEVLAGFLLALHEPAPPDAPQSLTRGVPLAGWHDDGLFEAVADRADLKGLEEVWAAAVAAPPWAGAPLWLHADLHPANTVTSHGMLTGVLDFGDMCSGDPATDLSAAWLLLPAGAASRFFTAYARADPATVRRARGWALLRAIGLVQIGVNGRLGLPEGKPTWEPAGHATLDRLLTVD